MNIKNTMVVKDYIGLLLTDLEKEAVSALKYFIKVSPCKNGCKPDDMTCATMRAKAVIRKVKGRK